MGHIRILIARHRVAVALLAALALVLKSLLPAGYMIDSVPDGPMRGLTVLICADAYGAHLFERIALPVQSKTAATAEGHGKARGACPYATLSLAALGGGADAPLLALALAFALTLGFAQRPFRPLAPTCRMRPPLRAPPA